MLMMTTSLPSSCHSLMTPAYFGRSDTSFTIPIWASRSIALKSSVMSSHRLSAAIPQGQQYVLTGPLASRLRIECWNLLSVSIVAPRKHENLFRREDLVKFDDVSVPRVERYLEFVDGLVDVFER